MYFQLWFNCLPVCANSSGQSCKPNLTMRPSGLSFGPLGSLLQNRPPLMLKEEIISRKWSLGLVFWLLLFAFFGLGHLRILDVDGTCNDGRSRDLLREIGEVGKERLTQREVRECVCWCSMVHCTEDPTLVLWVIIPPPGDDLAAHRILHGFVSRGPSSPGEAVKDCIASFLKNVTSLLVDVTSVNRGLRRYVRFYLLLIKTGLA